MSDLDRSDSATPEARTAQEILIDNGRAKYSATYINGIAVAVLAVGGVAPLVALAGDPQGRGLSWVLLGVGAVCWISGFVLHSIVLRRLGRLTA